MVEHMNRRRLLANALQLSAAAVLPIGALLRLPALVRATWSNPWSANPFDAFEMIPLALRYGLPNPTLGLWGEAAAIAAEAAKAEEWSICTIKVCNHVSTPLVFRYGALVGDTVPTTNVASIAATAGTAQTNLTSLGVERIAADPRMRALRFNQWFASMLLNGTTDGNVAASTNILSDPGDVAPLAEDKVALQTYHHVDQIAGQGNHSLKGCKIREDLPDLTLFLQEQGIIRSRLGITCFMMGNQYDKAEGSSKANAVLGAAAAETEIVKSRSVAGLVDNIVQSLGQSYVDRRSDLEKNLNYTLDRLAVSDPKLRRELLASRETFRNGIEGLRSASTVEKGARQTYNRDQANGQSAVGGDNGASKEFVAQCMFVARALDLEEEAGRPLNNFSLFLNMNDLDSKTLDAVTNNISEGQSPDEIQAYSYVEGMRQLAIGLNILGKKIAAGKRLIVVVVSEGGRGIDGSDKKVGWSIVMGPKGPGMLDDALVANTATITATAGTFDPATRANLSWDAGTLRTSEGNPETGVPNTGDVQMGVAQFLASLQGNSAPPNGRYALLKRK